MKLLDSKGLLQQSSAWIGAFSSRFSTIDTNEGVLSYHFEPIKASWKNSKHLQSHQILYKTCTLLDLPSHSLIEIWILNGKLYSEDYTSLDYSCNVSKVLMRQFQKYLTRLLRLFNIFYVWVISQEHHSLNFRLDSTRFDSIAWIFGSLALPFTLYAGFIRVFRVLSRFIRPLSFQISFRAANPCPPSISPHFCICQLF